MFDIRLNRIGITAVRVWCWNSISTSLSSWELWLVTFLRCLNACIYNMQQFCWGTSKLIEMGTKTMHAGREDKNQWGVKIKAHLNLHEKTAGWRIQLQMTSCIVCSIIDTSAWSQKCNEKINLKSKPPFTLKSRTNLIKGQNVPKLFSSLIWVVEGWKGTQKCYFSLDCKHGQNKLEKLQSGTKVVETLV